jgi:hypothetical protein
MPLTLTSRDKAYVRAVAHGGAHDMYKGILNHVKPTTNDGKFTLGTQHDHYVMFHLGEKPKSQINRTWHDASGNSHELQDIDHDLSSAYSNSINLNFANFAKGGDTAGTTKLHSKRYGDNVFLDSTQIRIRVSLPHARFNADEHSMCRMIVFRAREKQCHIPEESLDHANPHYDLFLTQSGYVQGLNGYVDHNDYENYIKRTTHAEVGPLALQNFLVNKSKYVVMKDCKFNLGKDFGALGFETFLRWDWQDRLNDIPATRHDCTAAQSGDGPTKNYEWYILIMGMNPTGATATQFLNIETLGTTHCKTTD